MPDIVSLIKSKFDERGGIYLLRRESDNNLFWIMRSEDEAFARALILFSNLNEPDTPLGKMVMGFLNRFNRGYLSNTVSNAYAAVALRRFAKKYSSDMDKDKIKVQYRCNASIKEVDRDFTYTDFNFLIDSTSGISGGNQIADCPLGQGDRFIIENKTNQFLISFTNLYK